MVKKNSGLPQRENFIDAAKENEADKDESAFERVIQKVAKHAPDQERDNAPPNPSANKGRGQAYVKDLDWRSRA